MTLQVKRVYADAAQSDGMRILVDRLWPRGLAKEQARVELWLKDIAPSDALRKRFHAKPGKWPAFLEAYAAELESGTAVAATKELRRHARNGKVTLLFAARDEEHNNAVALKTLLARRRRR